MLNLRDVLAKLCELWSET